MKIRNTFAIIPTLIIILIGIGLFNLYSFPSAESVKDDIQLFLNKEYNNKYNIFNITKDYNPDLFKEPWGYSITLEDSAGVRIENVYIQFNDAQNKWITFKGTDIEAEYKLAKKRNPSFRQE